MRVNLIAEPYGPAQSGIGKIPLSLTIRPACGFPGEYQFPIESEVLMRMLRQKTNLRATVLARFESELCSPTRARLLGVELSESVLTDIGYFID
jgi:hypothetical protein